MELDLTEALGGIRSKRFALSFVYCLEGPGGVSDNHPLDPQDFLI